jgi:hypothetical protein
MFCSLGLFQLGMLCHLDVLRLGKFLVAWDVFCSLGRFLALDVLYLGRYVFGRFVVGTICKCTKNLTS